MRRGEQRVFNEVLIPSKLGLEKIAMEACERAAEEAGLPPDRTEDLKTAVAEACINAIEHGNKGDETKSVRVEFLLDDSDLEVVVTDQGAGISDMAPDPDIDKKMAGFESARGMGMFLIRSLVDEVEWVSKPETGSCVRLTMHRNDADGEPAPEKIG